MQQQYWNHLIQLTYLLMAAFNLADALSLLELDFIADIQHTTIGQCTFVYYELQNIDQDKISKMAVKPVIIVKEGPTEASKSQFQEMVSVRMTGCVVLFCMPKSNLGDLSTLLKYNRHRSIFIFGGSTKAEHNFLFEDTTHVRKVAGGMLLLTSFCTTASSTPKNNFWTQRNINEKNTVASWRSCSSTLRFKNITVSTLFTPPNVIFLPHHKHIGSEIDLLNVIAQKIGFHYVIKEEGILTQKDQNTNSWIGVSGSVINGSSQLGLGTMPLSRPEDISTYPVEFSPQMSVMEAVYLGPKPKPLQPLGNFIRPFSPSVWICIFAMMVICAIVTALTNAFKKRIKLSLWKVLFDFNGVLWTQNLKETLISPRQHTFFVIFGFWLVGTFYIHAAYFCNLRAYIIKKDFEAPIESDSDVVQFHKDVYMPAGSWFIDNYQNAHSLDKNLIYKRAVEGNTILIYSKGVLPIGDEDRMIKEGGTRLIVKIKGSGLLMDTEKRLGYQPLRVAKTIVATVPLAIIMPMYQPWSEEFNKILQRTVESGIVEHFIAKYTPNNKYSFDVKDNADEELEPYKIEHIMGSLIILFVGFIIGILGMGMELAVKKFHLIMRISQP